MHEILLKRLLVRGPRFIADENADLVEVQTPCVIQVASGPLPVYSAASGPWCLSRRGSSPSPSGCLPPPQSAPTAGHAQHWLEYSAAETERDFDFARRLQLNQARVFIPYSAWAQNNEAFRKNLLHLIRAAHQRGIGVMPTLQYAPGVSVNKDRWPESKAFVADLIATIGKEPGLACVMVEKIEGRMG